MSPGPDAGPEGAYIPPPLSKSTKDIVDALKKPSAKESKVALEPFHRAARWFPLGVFPFVRVGDLLSVGVQKLTQPATTSPEVQDPLTNAQDDKNPDLILFNRLKELIPSLEDTLNELSIKDPTQLFLLSKYMTEQGQSQRQVDSSGIKTGIFSYMDSFTEPDTVAGLKSVTRGFNHPIFARLLVPRKWVHIFDRDPQDFMNKVNTRVIRPNSLDFPTFLYDEGTEYDSTFIENGLLRGKLLVRVYRHLFTGPSTALVGPAHIEARPTKAQRFRQHGCDAQTIAYAALQTYFTLSSAKEWKPETRVSGVNLMTFYNQIIRLLDPTLSEDDSEDNPEEDEEPTEPDMWIQDTLEWWNHQVGIYRGHEHQNRSGTDTEPESADDPMDVIKVQRRRRRKAAKKTTRTNHLDDNIDPVLREAQSQLENVANNLDNNIDPALRAAHPQHENHLVEQSHQNNPQNPNALAPNLQDQSQGDGQLARSGDSTTPLMDLNLNRPGAAEPPVMDSNAARRSTAQQKRQASSEAASDATKKQKASSIQTRSKRKRN